MSLILPSVQAQKRKTESRDRLSDDALVCLNTTRGNVTKRNSVHASVVHGEGPGLRVIRGNLLEVQKCVMGVTGAKVSMQNFIFSKEPLKQKKNWMWSFTDAH